MNPTAERFEAFHAANPIVHDTLVALIQEWVQEHGPVKVGIRMLWETARWRIIRSTRNVDYKMNDHFTSYYIRLILAHHDEWVDLFEIRESPANEWIAQRMGWT